jgi:sec-independent protein translocase protein TatA
MFGLGWQELLILLAIVLVIFGAGKLPQVGRSLGTAINEFKDSVKGPEAEEKPEEEKPAEQQQ